MCQRLADLHISVIFSKQLIHDLPTLRMGKRPIQGARQTSGFQCNNVQKFTNMDSDSALQLTFKETITCQVLV